MTRLTLYAVQHTRVGRAVPDPIDAVYLTYQEARKASGFYLTSGTKEIVAWTPLADADWQPVTPS